MDDDLKAVVERATRAVERPDVKLDGDLCLIHGDDLRTLLSAIRQRDEALRPFVDYAGHIDDGETFSDDSEIVSVLSGGVRRSIRFRDLRKARAILTGSETNAR